MKCKTMAMLLCAGWLVALPASAGAEGHECRAALARADALQSQAHRGQEARLAYERAFQICAEHAVVPEELRWRLLERQAWFLLAHEKDADAAAALYEQALQDPRLGEHDPMRIELLEGLAGVLDKRRLRGGSDRPAADEQRALELYHRAAELREQAFGEGSAEATRGLVLLAYAYLEPNPALAERTARQALAERQEACGLHGIGVRDALTVLRLALEKQGRIEDAEHIQSTMDSIPLAARDEACPADCCDERAGELG